MAPRGRLGLGRTGSVWLLTAAIAALSALLFLAIAETLPAPLTPIGIPWWTLPLGFCAAESLGVVHIHFRREAHTLSLSEVPLVLALLSASPGILIATQLAGMGAAFVLYRRQPLRKAAFNLAQTTLGSVLAIIVFRGLVHGRNPFGPLGWATGFGAAAASSLTGMLLVSAAVSITEGRWHFRRSLTTSSVSLFGTLTAASLALAGAMFAHMSVQAVPLLVLPGLLCVIAFHVYAAERRRHEHMQSLYDSLQSTEGQEVSSAVRQLLLTARRLFRADYAELLLFQGADRETALRSTIGTSRELLMEPTALSAAEWTAVEIGSSEDSVVLPRDKRFGKLDLYVSERGLRDAIIVPLAGEGGLLGLLTIGDRASDVSTFSEDDAKLLRTFAGHASLLLENEQLEQSLATLMELEDQLRHQALHDALTGLPNRRLFETRVGETAERSPAQAGEPVVLFLDLDDFKTINDSLGHAVGDEVLTTTARRLRDQLRSTDTCARLGGDEFAVLLEACPDLDAVQATATKLLRALSEPIVLAGREIMLRASIGIAPCFAGCTVSELLRNADLAMYRAKNAGKNRWQLFEPDLLVAAHRRLELKSELEQAVEREELEVHYQPIVQLDGGRVTAFEALVRWPHATRGLLLPDDFIPLAEETGLIVPIGRLVLEEACATASRLGDGLVPIHVNVSARQLQERGLAAFVDATLSRTGLPPDRLTLEITETELMADTDTTSRRLAELKEVGVQIAIDDFGTGYSSLGYLRHFPVDMLKIAKEFVQGADAADATQPLIEAIIQLGGALELAVVAEGIETRLQRRLVRRLGCHLGQGFLFSRPVDASRLEGYRQPVAA